MMLNQQSGGQYNSRRLDSKKAQGRKMQQYLLREEGTLFRAAEEGRSNAPRDNVSESHMQVNLNVKHQEEGNEYVGAGNYL